MRFFCFYLLCTLISVQPIIGHCHCPESALAPLSFVLEYAIWRGWSQAIIYTPELEQGCQWTTIRLMKCLSVNGVASSSNILENIRLQTHLGVVVLGPRLNRNSTGNLTNLLKRLHELQMDTSSFDWLITARSYQDFGYINDVLNATSIRFDQNIVVSYPFSKSRHERHDILGVCDLNFNYEKSNNYNQPQRTRYSDNSRNGSPDQRKLKTDYEKNYYRSTERFRNLTRHKTYKRDGSIIPLFQAGVTTYNYSRTFDMVNVSRFSLKNNTRKSAMMYNVDSATGKIIIVVQYFKVRENSTLYAYYLGEWNRFDSMSIVEAPFPVEVRNFLGEELIIGRCNSTNDGTPAQDDEGPSSGPMLDDILNFLTTRLNSKSMIRHYGKLGFRTYEGTWTGLLGALIEHSVDMALEPVTVHPARRQDMDFIFPIAETMCNIYIRQQETSTVRDIFLAPFSFRLVACVGGVALLAAVAIMVISRMTSSLKECSRQMGCAEAVIWSTGILCQQGGTWTPSNPAASILLIVCLFFAVVTYNSYAAFITSVLSVRVASLDTIAAVLHSPNFKIGYIRNGADQMYLMSTKDVQLNAFYIRGYSDADNLVSSAEEGLARVAQQDYAFFAGQRVARSTLRSLSQARGRCAVRELPVYSTRAHLAFPLPRHSPYARPTLVCLLQLRSGGALARLEAALVPDMPQCEPSTGFASARATDVRSALILFIVGLISSLILGLGEYSWKNRQKLRLWLMGCCYRLINIIMQ